jgi:hypothetical protein
MNTKLMCSLIRANWLAATMLLAGSVVSWVVVMACLCLSSPFVSESQEQVMKDILVYPSIGLLAAVIWMGVNTCLPDPAGAEEDEIVVEWE